MPPAPRRVSAAESRSTLSSSNAPCLWASVSWMRTTSPGLSSTRRIRTGEARSEEHTSELQSHSDLVCRLLLEKKKKKQKKKKKKDKKRTNTNTTKQDQETQRN